MRVGGMGNRGNAIVSNRSYKNMKTFDDKISALWWEKSLKLIQQILFTEFQTPLGKPASSCSRNTNFSPHWKQLPEYKHEEFPNSPVDLFITMLFAGTDPLNLYLSIWNMHGHYQSFVQTRLNILRARLDLVLATLRFLHDTQELFQYTSRCIRISIS